MNGEKIYPYTSFRFRVEIDHLKAAQVSEISGLSIETETEPFEEGGVNDFVYQFPKRTKYQHIILKRGITEIDDFWNWYNEVVNGIIKRKEVAVVLMDVTGKDRRQWNIIDAYPVKWTGPDMKADSNTVAFESIELAHHGIKKV